jgi:putative oxidoreductase
MESVDANARSRYPAYIHVFVAKVDFAFDRRHETRCPLRRDATVGGAPRFATGPYSARTKDKTMKTLIDWLIRWPERVAQHLGSLAPLFARIVVGWVFLWSGWGKLNNLPAIIENFAGWHIPAAPILAPFVSGVEFFGGIFLLLGLLTRISAGALGITMIVAIASAKWDQVDSVETLLGFDETEYLALFLWLAVAGAGRFSIDRLLNRSLRA